MQRIEGFQIVFAITYWSFANMLRNSVSRLLDIFNRNTMFTHCFACCRMYKKTVALPGEQKRECIGRYKAMLSEIPILLVIQATSTSNSFRIQ